LHIVDTTGRKWPASRANSSCPDRRKHVNCPAEKEKPQVQKVTGTSFEQRAGGDAASVSSVTVKLARYSKWATGAGKSSLSRLFPLV
jgi:hypothetical protein